jgi:hypothetical protein
MIVLGVVLVLAGAYVMAWSRRLQRVDVEGEEAPSLRSLSAFLLGGAAVAVGAILITDWWVG